MFSLQTDFVIKMGRMFHRSRRCASTFYFHALVQRIGELKASVWRILAQTLPIATKQVMHRT
jgi:hypothetical protein